MCKGRFVLSADGERFANHGCGRWGWDGETAEAFRPKSNARDQSTMVSSLHVRNLPVKVTSSNAQGSVHEGLLVARP